MRSFGVILLSCVALCSGCAKHYRDTALYHSSGRAKPLVAILPVLDSSGFNKVKWNVAEELTDTMRSKASASSRLYLLTQEGGLSLAKTLNTKTMDAVPASTFDQLAPAEFVVVSELIEQDEEVYGHKNAKGARPREVGAKINLAMRVRVIDLRGKEPKIVLQEVLSENMDIGLNYLHTNYDKTPWGSAGYINTPLGMAHNKLIASILAHVEGYVGL